MSASGRGALDPKALLQELKNNKKTQAALGMMVLVLAYSLYSLFSDSPKPRPKTAAHVFSTSGAGDKQFQALSKLPNLAQLNQAGELPGEKEKMYRDLFLYDMPAPPPVVQKPVPPPPPPPPPTPEQIAAENLRRERETEMNTRPQSLRYLGYMGNKSSGRLGDFLRGEDPVTLRVGDLATPQWKLVTLAENYAEFQNQKYPDLRFRSETNDNRANTSNTPSNEF